MAANQVCEAFYQEEWWSLLEDTEKEDITQEFFEEYVEKSAISTVAALQKSDL